MANGFIYPKHLDVTEVKIELLDGINKDGSPKVIGTYEGKCRFNEKTKRVMNENGKLIQLEAKLYIGCDIAPAQPIIEGKAIINEREYQIYRSARPRDITGKVCFTKLELI